MSNQVAKQEMKKIRLVSESANGAWMDVEVTPDQLMFLDWLVTQWNAQNLGLQVWFTKIII